MYGSFKITGIHGNARHVTNMPSLEGALGQGPTAGNGGVETVRYSQYRSRGTDQSADTRRGAQAVPIETLRNSPNIAEIIKTVHGQRAKGKKKEKELLEEDISGSKSMATPIALDSPNRTVDERVAGLKPQVQLRVNPAAISASHDTGSVGLRSLS
jgi:hypothetical protein